MANAEKFIGCILSLRRKVGNDSDTIIGTLRGIDQKNQTITLDDAICNGTCLIDGYTIPSSEIVDLNVIAQAEKKENEKLKSKSKVQNVPYPFEDLLDKLSMSVKKEKEQKSKKQNPFSVGIGGALGIYNVAQPEDIDRNNGSSPDPIIVYSATAHESVVRSARPFKLLNDIPSAEANILLQKFSDLQKLSPQMEPQTSTMRNGSNGKVMRTPTKQSNKGNYNNPNNFSSPKQRNDHTFEMTKKEIQSQDFDFEENLAQFKKLPVNPKAKKVEKNPHFCPADTTTKAERQIEATKLIGKAVAKKNFVTDTGIIVPSLELKKRESIFQMANENGLSTSRMVEIMGRAAALTCLPFLGDSYRLSPEREEDRPRVLVCCGSVWQGAVGLCAARILASLGVHVVVYSSKTETNPLVSIEEQLYKLTGQKFTTDIRDFAKEQFDFVIMAMDGYKSKQYSLDTFKPWTHQNLVMLIDPPVLSHFDLNKTHILEKFLLGENSLPKRTLILSPAFPLPYMQTNDSQYKYFLVNMGIPSDIFYRNEVVYKSPFGDKLTIQIFPSKNTE